MRIALLTTLFVGLAVGTMGCQNGAIDVELPAYPEQCLYDVHFQTDLGYMALPVLCVESKSGLPIKLGYFGNGVFVYDDAGYIYPIWFMVPEKPQIEEFRYGVH
jgi:hypothetical protein